jgi:uncharacterized protein YjbI with pentapeptide repeats
MLNSKFIGNKIAVARKKINLSQAELAKQVSISSQAVGKWERGESMPDITTLNRIAEILGVDLNYFSERFQSIDSEEKSSGTLADRSVDFQIEQKKKPGWDMSKLNLTDSDFSGLKNLHEKLSTTNIQRCLFIGSDLSGLVLKRNNVDSCDFSSSDFSGSQIQNSYLNKNIFKNCSLKETEFSESFFSGCDFSDADFNKLVARSSGFEKCIMTNAVLNHTSFFNTVLADIVFEGTLEDCCFEDCTFHKVKFQNATLINTFFKNNKKFKRVQFINCKVDKLTYAFLKNNQANLTGITLFS